MNGIECEREREVFEAIDSGRWPGQCEESLRKHVDGCAICSEVVLVAGFLRAEEEAAWREAKIPDAERIWWKGQFLARRAATARALRPIAFVEKLASVCALLSLAGVVGWQWAWIREALARLASVADSSAFALRGSFLAAPNASWLLLTIAAASLLLMALAAFVFIRAED